MNGLHLIDEPMTYDELADLPDDLKRHELIGGELIATPAPLIVHQRVVGNLLIELGRYVEAKDLGEVFPPLTDVRFSLYDVVKPDLLYVSRERRHRLKAAYVDGAPDLIIKVLGDNTRRLDRIRKQALYATHGVPEYWLVDIDARRVVVLTLAAGKYDQVSSKGALVPSVVLPDLRLDRAAVSPADHFPWSD